MRWQPRHDATKHSSVPAACRIGTLLRLALMYGPGGQSARLEALCQDYLREVASELAPEQTDDVLRLIDASVIHGPGGKDLAAVLCTA